MYKIRLQSPVMHYNFAQKLRPQNVTSCVSPASLPPRARKVSTGSVCGTIAHYITPTPHARENTAKYYGNPLCTILSNINSSAGNERDIDTADVCTLPAKRQNEWKQTNKSSLWRLFVSFGDNTHWQQQQSLTSTPVQSGHPCVSFLDTTMVDRWMGVLAGMPSVVPRIRNKRKLRYRCSRIFSPHKTHSVLTSNNTDVPDLRSTVGE